jgi:hypothetical protein
MMLFCQCLLLAVVVMGFFRIVYQDFNGRPAKEPAGFNGFIGTVVAVALVGALYYGAGAFSLIFGGSP